MTKLKIKDVAAIAEIIASIAVVISLIIVILSINRNTVALRSINDNFIYQLADERQSDMTTDGELASIVARYDAGDELNEAEENRYYAYQFRQMNIWELAFNRHAEGLMPPSQWDAWNVSMSAYVPEQIPKEVWIAERYTYGADFALHVDAVYLARLAGE